ncbi:MAG: phosphotransferase [Chloroflexota bacterium]
MDKLDNARFQQIATALDENVESVQLNQEGVDNLIVEINGKWIFRFPRNEGAQDNLKKEQRLLSRISHKLPLPVPHYEHVHEDFVAYRKLQGQGLRKERFDALGTAHQERIAECVGAFLTALHNAIDDLDEPLDESKNQLNFWDEVWPAVEIQLSARCRTNARNYFEEMGRLPYEDKLIHGDFKFKHLLFDGRRVSGILDFGCAEKGDPARDIARISERYGRGFMQRILNQYVANEQDDLIAIRAEHYRRRGLCFLIFDNNQQACRELEALFG